MPGTPQTLPVPPPVSILTMLNAIRLAAGSGGSGGAAWGSITGTLSAQTDLQTALDAKVPLTSFTGGGILATAGFTLTVPATGTAALLGTANVFTAAQTINVTGAALDIQSAGASKFKFTTAAINILDVAGDGSANQFSIKVGTGTILTASAYGLATGYLSGGTLIHVVESTGLVMQAKPLCFGPGGYAAATLFLSQKSAATLQLGLDAAGVTNQMFTAASRITSDGVGADLTLAGGNGRGAAGGSLILSTYDTGAAATIGVLRSRMTFDTAGAISFPVVTAVTTETVVSDTTWPVTINGVAYKVCLKA